MFFLSSQEASQEERKINFKIGLSETVWYCTKDGKCESGSLKPNLKILLPQVAWNTLFRVNQRGPPRKAKYS